jgi:hypothetical protein
MESGKRKIGDGLKFSAGDFKTNFAVQEFRGIIFNRLLISDNIYEFI